MSQNKEVVILAEEIAKITKGFEELLSSGLKKEAIIALLRAMPGTNKMSQKKVMAVLENLGKLRKEFINEGQLEAKVAIRNLKK